MSSPYSSLVGVNLQPPPTIKISLGLCARPGKRIDDELSVIYRPAVGDEQQFEHFAHARARGIYAHVTDP
jgi:hypothetical protein